MIFFRQKSPQLEIINYIKGTSFKKKAGDYLTFIMTVTKLLEMFKMSLSGLYSASLEKKYIAYFQ